MAQNYTINSYITTNEGYLDLEKFENNFECLRSMFSGSTSIPLPTNVAGMPWFDTTKKILKIRNVANDNWLGVMYGNTNTKIWIFEEIARNGWKIDTTVYDVVLALKGGSNDYNVSGGTQAGTWTTSNHTLVEDEIPTHDHGETGAHTHAILVTTGGSYHYGTTSQTSAGHVTKNTNIGGAHTHASVGSNSSHNHGLSWRPLASVGTLQHPDI